MKSQYANNKLKFDKHSLVELNENSLSGVNGGSSPTIIVPITVSIIITIATTAGVKR